MKPKGFFKRDFFQILFYTLPLIRLVHGGLSINGTIKVKTSCVSLIRDNTDTPNLLPCAHRYRKTVTAAVATLNCTDKYCCLKSSSGVRSSNLEAL